MEAIVFGAPQIIWLALAALGMGLSIAKHGEPSRHNAGAHAFALAFITIPLLYWGGFFTA